MSGYRCTKCGAGQMTPVTVGEYNARLGGIEFLVRDAKIRRCPECGEVAVGARELKRWRILLRQHLRERGQLPSGEDVRRLRGRLGVSISDFAGLMGVTRQTVYGWERKGEPMPLGPAALLLAALIQEASEEGSIRLLETLVCQARERGLAVENMRCTTTRQGASRVGNKATRTRESGAPSFKRKAA